MPRYLPVQLDSANADIQAVYREVEREVGLVPQFIKTLAHSPNYLKPVADLYRAIMAGESSLSDKLRHLVILKTCKVDRCKPTVKHLTRLALDAGWTEEQIEAFEAYAESDLFNYYEKDALSLVEQVLERPDDISEPLFWTQLDNHFTSDQVVEMITLIGFFNMINRLIHTVEIAPDPTPENVE